VVAGVEGWGTREGSAAKGGDRRQGRRARVEEGEGQRAAGWGRGRSAAGRRRGALALGLREGTGEVRGVCAGGGRL